MKHVLEGHVILYPAAESVALILSKTNRRALFQHYSCILKQIKTSVIISTSPGTLPQILKEISPYRLSSLKVLTPLLLCGGHARRLEAEGLTCALRGIQTSS